VKSKRIINQIRTLDSAFREVHEKFLQGKPVDREMGAFFRRNRQMGAKDRRFVSNAIFGYYRWYGWLRRLETERVVPALMLGYLLDGNGVDDRVRYGLESFGQLFKKPIDPVRFCEARSLLEKTVLFTEAVLPVSPSELIPQLTGDLNTEQLESIQTRPPVWVRLVYEEGGSFVSFLESRSILYRFHDWNPQALEIISPLNILESLDFRNGRVEIQDISSQAVGLICQPQIGSCWWDACAGSGGKALHLSALMQGKGVVYATETDRYKFEELQRRVSKNQLFKNVRPLKWDGIRLPEFGKQMDGVLIDAPCSCSGTWRRNPDIRWHITRERISEYVRVQQALLEICCDGVKEGGVLVYATCSLFSEENEAVVEMFLRRHSEFVPVRIENPFTRQSGDPGIMLGPPELNGNGMFVAKLKKQE